MATVSKKIPKRKKAEVKDISDKVKQQLLKIKVINLGLIAVLILIIFLGISVIYLNNAGMRIFPNLFQDKTTAKASDIAAIVNDDIITFAELEERYGLLPVEYQSLISKNEVLSQMIDEKLLLQGAKAQNIDASDEEVDELLNEILDQSSITSQEFESSLFNRGIELKTVKDFYRRDIIISKFLNMTLTSMIKVSDTDIKDYYFRNAEEFNIPELRNVSHILICHNESLRCIANNSKIEAYTKIQEILSEVNSSTFGEYAYNYSDEPAAKITYGNIGWVTPEDFLDEVFLNATFDLNEYQISNPVETVFGYHLILVTEIQPPETIELENVYEQINLTLTSTSLEETYMVYIDNLRNESNIIKFLS